METKKSETITPKLSYKILGLIVLGVIFYGIGNAGEIDVDNEVDFYEWIIMLGYGAAAALAVIIAKRYQGSEVFGKAYLALAIGIAGKLTGWVLWFAFMVSNPEVYPYPYWPDLFFVIYYAGTLIHLRVTTHYFLPEISRSKKFILVMMPVVAAAFFIYFGMFMEINWSDEGIMIMKAREVMNFAGDWDIYWKYFFTGLGFVILSIFTLAYALVGFGVFRGGILGPAWGLLLAGLAIKSLADIQYYFSELFGVYDRAHPMTAMWVLGIVIVTYALYKHKSL